MSRLDDMRPWARWLSRSLVGRGVLRLTTVILFMPVHILIGMVEGAVEGWSNGRRELREINHVLRKESHP